MSDNIADKIPYRLPLSLVNIVGTITSDFDPRTSKPRTSAASDIHVSVEADPRASWEQRLSMASSFAKDVDFDLKLTPDGRLTSSSGTVTGAGGALLEAGIKVGTFIGSTIIGLTSKGLPLTGAAALKDMGRTDVASFDDTLEAEEKPLYELREAYRTAIVALQNRLAAYGDQVAKSSELGSGKQDDGSALHGALELVRAEAAEVEAQVDAWRRSRFPSTSHERSTAIATDELPVLQSAEPSHRFDLAQLPAVLRDTAEHLGVVVAEVLDPAQPRANPVAALDARAQSGIWFRATRPASLAIYERPLGSDVDFKLRVVTHATVIDSKSDLDFVALDSGVFDKHASTLEFGDSGALSHVSRTTESAARQLSTALSTAPAAIKGAVEQAGAVSSEIAKLQSEAATRRLAELNRRKETIGAEIAEKGALATRAQREALAALNVQIELAEAEHKLTSLPVAAPPAK